MLKLQISTADIWTRTVVSDLDAFLLDHAACERKASAMALKLATHYPDKPELVESMIELAREELEHFQQVYGWIAKRGLQLAPDTRDPYVGALRRLARTDRRLYFLDQLVLAGVIEARGCERFGLVGEALPEGPLKDFYKHITSSEARHHGLFLRLAKIYFPVSEVDSRLQEILRDEAKIVQDLPIRAALH